MEIQIWKTENTFFIPKSGLDAANYILLSTQIKLAIHDETPVKNLHFLSDLQQIIDLHKQTLRTVVAEDGSIRKSTSLDVINSMEDLLQRLDEAGLRLCFRMWSILTADELVTRALSEANALDAIEDTEESHHSYLQHDCSGDGNGAVVAFMIIPNSLPTMVPENGVGHKEICVCHLPDWNMLPNELIQT